MGRKHKVVNKYSFDQLGSRIHVNLKAMIDIRIQRGWNQDEMAERVGMSLSNYQKFEQQVRVPSPDHFSRVIYALGDDSWLKIERTRMCCSLRTAEEKQHCHVCRGKEHHEDPTLTPTL